MRLTTHDKRRQPYVITANERTWREIYDKLAAYEDTGFEPEEIDFCLSGVISPQEAKERYEAHKNRYDEWFAWKQAEEQGLLVRLPCKVGDMVYYKRGRDILGDTVERIVVDGIDNQIILNAHRTFLFCDLGRNVFLTFEEADAALKGEKA